MSDATQGTDPANAATSPSSAAAPDGAQPNDGGAASAPAAAEPSAASNEDLKREISGIQKRFDELTRERYSERRAREDAERERDYWRAQSQQRQEPPPQAQTPQAPKTLADFDYDEGKFHSYLSQETSKTAVEAARKELREQADRETRQRRVGEFLAREAKFAEAAKDYHEAVYSERTHISAAMAEVITESEEGPAVAYHLAKNPQVAEKIAQLPALAAARELGRIEAKLVIEREQADKAKPKVSEAPPPAPKIEGSGDGATRVSTSDPESDKLSDEEWVKAERARVARKAKRQNAA